MQLAVPQLMWTSEAVATSNTFQSTVIFGQWPRAFHNFDFTLIVKLKPLFLIVYQDLNISGISNRGSKESQFSMTILQFLACEFYQFRSPVWSLSEYWRVFDAPLAKKLSSLLRSTSLWQDTSRVLLEQHSTQTWLILAPELLSRLNRHEPHHILAARHRKFGTCVFDIRENG